MFLLACEPATDLELPPNAQIHQLAGEQEEAPLPSGASCAPALRTIKQTQPRPAAPPTPPLPQPTPDRSADPAIGTAGARRPPGATTEASCRADQRQDWSPRPHQPAAPVPVPAPGGARTVPARFFGNRKMLIIAVAAVLVVVSGCGTMPWVDHSRAAGLVFRRAQSRVGSKCERSPTQTRDSQADPPGLFRQCDDWLLAAVRMGPLWRRRGATPCGRNYGFLFSVPFWYRVKSGHGSKRGNTIAAIKFNESLP